MEKVAIIVGNGELPVKFIKAATANGIDPYPIGLFDTIAPVIKEHKNYTEISIGEIEKIVTFLIKNNIKKAVMLGKVDKHLLFNGITFDKIGRELLESLPDQKDETLLYGVIALFRLNGIKILSQSHLLKNLIVKDTVYTIEKPRKDEEETIKIGLEAAYALTAIDAGQCVTCKDQTVVTLEGMEGTDNTITRGYEYVGEGLILVKAARPSQDMRVDIPTIGLETVKKVIEVKGRGIVLEEKKMLFVDQEECIKLANKHKIFIMGTKRR